MLFGLIETRRLTTLHQGAGHSSPTICSIRHNTSSDQMGQAAVHHHMEMVHPGPNISRTRGHTLQKQVAHTPMVPPAVSQHPSLRSGLCPCGAEAARMQFTNASVQFENAGQRQMPAAHHSRVALELAESFRWSPTLCGRRSRQKLYMAL